MQVASYQRTELFFRDKLRDALRRQKVRLSRDSKAYLVFLLDMFVDGKLGRTLPADPFAILFGQACNRDCPPHQREKLFQTIGDSSLLLSGFWWESLNRRGRRADPDYLISLGQAAYGKLDLDHFQELSRRFPLVVDALMDMGVELRLSRGSMADLLQLFETAQRTDSPFLRKLLGEKGFRLPSLSSSNVH